MNSAGGASVPSVSSSDSYEVVNDETVDPTGGQIDFLGRDFRVKQSTPCKTWGFVDMETTNKHAKTQKYTRVLARRSQLFFQQGPDGISR